MIFSRKSKLFASLAGIFSLSGVSFPLLDQNIVSSALKIAGGGFKGNLTEEKMYLKKDKLDLMEENTQEINLKLLKKDLTSRVKLKKVEEKSSNLDSKISSLELIDSSSSLTAEKIHREVDKEEKVISIEKDQLQTYSSHEKDIKKHTSSFKTAQEEITKYETGSSFVRKARSLAQPKRQLTVSEKEAIYSFFDIFDKLGKSSSSLLGRLRDITGEEKITTKTEENNKLILRNLDRAGWKNKDLQLTPAMKGGRSAHPNPTFENAFGWENWNNSPWYPFFENIEEWKERVKGVKDSEVALTTYMTGRRFPCLVAMIASTSGVDSCYSEKKRYEEKISSGKGDLEVHIASFLLKKMGVIQANTKI